MQGITEKAMTIKQPELLRTRHHSPSTAAAAGMTLDTATESNDHDDELGALVITTDETKRSRRHQKVAVRRWWIQCQTNWRRLSRRTQGVCWLMGMLGSVHLLGTMVDAVYGSVRHDPIVSTETTFAVVINTFRRPQMLQQAVQHYAVTCGPAHGVAHVYIVWADLATVPPPSVEAWWLPPGRLRRKQQQHAPTTIVRAPRDSLNARFLPIAHVSTPAIFMVDDDVRVDCASLRRGFRAWQAHPDSMVGYYPRLAAVPWSWWWWKRQEAPWSSTQFVYHSWPRVYLEQRMNFVLTKAAFLHHDYMQSYSTSTSMQAVRNYVDAHFNCEDVAMSLWIAHETARASKNAIPAMPMYVEASISDQGLFGGISTGSGHMTKRSACLTDLTKLLPSTTTSKMDSSSSSSTATTTSPFQTTFALSDAAWTRHVPWWRTRPSNVFEWFALENVFK